MKLIIFLLFPLLLGIQNSAGQSVAQWRGPFRNGIYEEKNLLKTWPQGGPRLLWSYEGVGAGPSSPVVADGKIFVTGIPDTLSSIGKLYAFDLNGKLLWEKAYGTDFTEYSPGTRSTPVVADDMIYIESGNGVLYCLKTNSGEFVWSVDFFKDLKADSVQFGFSESPLVNGNRIYCTPGGKENNIVALNRFTGEKIWAGKGIGEQATYSSPILFNHNGNEIIVYMTASSILGIDAVTGNLLWRFYQFQDNKIHANTPVYVDGKVLVSSTSRKDSSGLVLLQLSADGRQASVKWRNKEVINLMGGVIVMDGFLYLSAYIQPKWYCIDLNTGLVKYIARDIGGGSVIFADGLFYCYTEKDGEMALVNATSEAFKVIGRFKVPDGTAEHWAHPVISNGRLFLRHGNSLMAFDIQNRPGIAE
jgi:outer membrane protein assembly factor BamB